MQKWLFSCYMQSNRQTAWLATQIAEITLLLSRPLPLAARNPGKGFACWLKKIAWQVVQPEYVCALTRPYVFSRTLLDSAAMGALLGIAVAYLFVLQDLPIFAALLLAGVFLGIGTLFIITLLSLGGDIYRQKQDEYQRLLSQQASAYTLKAGIILLLPLALSSVLFHIWISWIPAYFCLLLFLLRFIYLLKLAQLRWLETTEIGIEDGLE